MKKVSILSLALFISIACNLIANAASEGEKFIAPMTKGFKIGFQNRQNGLSLTEMVPTHETVHNWTEMHTVQIFYNKQIPIKKFFTLMKKGMDAGCESTNDLVINKGIVNGYRSGQMNLFCSKEKKTGKGSFTMIHTFQGRDSFYIYQMAVRGDPFDIDQQRIITRDKLLSWVGIVRKITVCDTRDAERPCPLSN